MSNISKLSLHPRYYIFLIIFLSTRVLHSQVGEHFIQNYLPKNYGTSANNFGITQNSEGLIFIANNNCVLIYDGINWDQCKRADEIAIMSIARTDEGEIVVGTSDGDIAVITKNKKGKFQYTSLLNKLPPDKRPQEIIRQIVSVGHKTYFLSADKLIEYENSMLKAFEPIENFHARALVLGKHIFVCDVNNHLSVIINGELKPISGTEKLSNEKFFFCYQLSSSDYAIGFRNLGIYLAHYDSAHPTLTTFRKSTCSSDEELIPAEINNGCSLRNGNYVVTTNKKGAFELDKNLKIVDRFDSRSGIYDENVKSAFQDLNGNLWLALYYGIGFVETNSQLSQYTRRNGITGLVQSAGFFNGRLFIATDKGVQYYDSLQEKFVTFKDFNKQSWYLLPDKRRLFIGTLNGLFICENDQLKQVSQNSVFCLLRDPFRPDLLYAGTDDGIDLYSLGGGKFEKIISYNLHSPVKSLTSDATHNIYFSTVDRGVYFLNYMKSYSLDSLRLNVDVQEQEVENSVLSYKGRLLIGSGNGIYTVKNTDKRNFTVIKDPQFWPLTKGAQIFRATQFGDGIICSQKYPVKEEDKLEQKITFLETNPNTLTTSSRILNHLSDVKPNLISTDSAQGIVFICADEGLFIYDSKKRDETRGIRFSIKKIKTKTDTLLENVSTGDSLAIPELIIPYKNNDISLLLGFTSYATSSVEFCYTLEGRDKRYSKWDKENKLAYNNLYEGNYVLKVKARTELEEKEYTMEIPFTILPPWYRSVYAYIFYLILFIAFIFLVVKLNSRRLVAQNKKLEKTIEERTSTISQQKEEIEHKQKEIIDSINYAQRIQRALLASEQILKEHLPEYFVFFQPKDVVSGDFYWAAVLENNQFALVTADSTGHGVPGAIMSMLNISCLKEAVEAEKLTSPNEILNHTRKGIIKTLANDGSAEGGKDGMDCSLVAFDFKKHELQIAAANNPVWIVRAGELIEIKPDKMPVGKHDKDKESFTLKTIEIIKGDVVYTLTDGFPDQFGGELGKKFMSKKLKELLLTHAHLPMKEQKLLVESTFKNWVGNLEQIDDVTIIGVRL